MDISLHELSTAFAVEWRTYSLMTNINIYTSYFEFPTTWLLTSLPTQH